MLKGLSALVSRTKLGDALGQTYSGGRDIYVQCGYPKEITFAEYEGRYRRQDIANRIVNAYPDATWRGMPRVYENDEETETAFEKAWAALLDIIPVFHYLHRADRLAGIGDYGALFYGFADGGQAFDQPATTATGLLYLQPHSSDSAKILKLDGDTESERYNQPDMYNVTLGNPELDGSAAGTSSNRTLVVHHSRILHLADGAGASDTYGTPRLEAVFNRLLDMDKLASGSAEMFWKNAYPGYAFEASPDVDLTQGVDDLKDEMEGYFQHLTRYMRVQGIEVKSLAPQTADPSGQIDGQFKFISAATRIPIRILIGSERGELASSQDERAWKEQVATRRENFAEPSVLRPFVDDMIRVGILPEPVDGYEVEWPDQASLQPKEAAEVAKLYTESLARYTESGAGAIMPPYTYFTEVLGLAPEKAKGLVDELEQAAEEEDKEREAAEKAAAALPKPLPPSPREVPEEEEEV